MKPSKCSFCCSELLYLGYLVTPQGLKPDPSKVRAIQEYPVPTNASGVHTFLGMTGHYRQFISKYAPILALPDFTRKFKFILQTDASDNGLGAVLCQEQAFDGKLHPVAFASRGLTKDELKYHTQEKEALGIIWACEKFRPYLMGEKFQVETDHSSLQWLLGNRKGRLARWAMRLSEFDLTIKPKPGKNNGNADAPSRYPVDAADETWSPEDSAPDYTDLMGPVEVAMCNLTTDQAAAMIEVLALDEETEETAPSTDADTYVRMTFRQITEFGRPFRVSEVKNCTNEHRR